jgi:hypothetical protein
MLEFLRGKASDRKLWLFAMACCRRIWHFFDGRSHNLVEVSERFADGAAGRTELSFAWDLNLEALQSAEPYTPTSVTAHMAGTLATGAAWAVAWNIVSDARRAMRYSSRQADTYQESQGQAALLREVFGPLSFHLVSLDPSWLTPTVKALALAIYTDRTFTDIPVLADALEEAYCSNEEILNHCRGRGPHVLGCWVLDLLLAKE